MGVCYYYGNDVEETADKWIYINPNQPADPIVGDVRLGGDYTIDVDVAANGDVAYTGYSTIIEKYDAEQGTWVDAEFAQQDFGADATTLTVGGRYTTTRAEFAAVIQRFCETIAK
jgi:hypothetical protein